MSPLFLLTPPRREKGPRLWTRGAARLYCWRGHRHLDPRFARVKELLESAEVFRIARRVVEKAPTLTTLCSRTPPHPSGVFLDNPPRRAGSPSAPPPFEKRSLSNL